MPELLSVFSKNKEINNNNSGKKDLTKCWNKSDSPDNEPLSFPVQLLNSNVVILFVCIYTLDH